MRQEAVSKKWAVGLVGALAWLILFVPPTQADARVLFDDCSSSHPKFQPKSVDLLCSASLHSDGYRMIFRTRKWDSWRAFGGAKATGTAIIPKAYITGKYPTCWKANCTMPLVKRPARIWLSKTTYCWNRAQFNRARLWIEGTKWANEPWDSTTSISPFRCAPRPKTRKPIFRADALKGFRQVLSNNPYRTAWRAAYGRGTLKCGRRAKYRFRCSGTWFAGDLVYMGKATVRSVPTRSESPRARVKVRVVRFNEYCIFVTKGSNCVKRFTLKGKTR